MLQAWFLRTVRNYENELYNPPEIRTVRIIGPVLIIGTQEYIHHETILWCKEQWNTSLTIRVKLYKYIT